MQKELAQHCSNFFSAEYAALVEEEVRENSGICLPNFQSAQVFKGLMHREIAKLKKPASTLLEGSRALVHHVLTSVCRSIFSAYPALLQRVLAQEQAYMDARVCIIQERLEEFLLQEEEIFTINSYYLDTSHKIKHAINERLYAIQQQQQQQGGQKSVPSHITIPINDLTVTIHLAELIRHAEQRHHQAQQQMAAQQGGGSVPASSPASSASSSAAFGGIQTLLNPNGASILEMQINAFAYTQVMHKRLCDALPLLIRFHLLRALTHSPATASALAQMSGPPGSSLAHLSLSAVLQREFIDMADKILVECMKEEPATAKKRDELNKKIDKMTKAMAVFDAL